MSRSAWTIGGDRGKVEVRESVGLAAGIRATQDGRDDPIVGLAGSNEAIDGQPMGR